MNPIFGYKASEELGEDSWKGLVKASLELLQSTKATEVDDQLAVLKDYFGACEIEYKETAAQPVPAAWRSAKSVVLNATKHGVPLLEGKGKTAVEKEIKAKKDALADALSDPLSLITKKADAVLAYADSLGYDFYYSITRK